MKRKKIALLLGQGDEEYQSGFVTGFLKEAYSRDFDVCLFSMFIKYQNTREREIGDSNIYNLINYDAFDAIVCLMDSIQTPGVANEIEDRLKERFNGPVVFVDKESDNYPVIWTDGYDLIYKTVSHLIEVHGYKDIAFLTGKRWHVHSIRRVEAYKKAMEDHGLTVRDDRIYEGDFWYTSGSLCAEKILRKKNDMPEAIACANDCMAIGLCSEFEKKGIRIPEDIAVTGYDATEEGRTSPKPLTSPYIPAEEYGSYSVDYAVSLLEGKEPEKPNVGEKIFYGSSCGCKYHSETVNGILRKTWDTDTSDEGFYSIHNFMMDDLMDCDDLSAYLDIVFSYAYQLTGIEELHMCLNSDIVSVGGLSKCSKPGAGYDALMLHALEYYRDGKKQSRVGLDKFFKKADMSPVKFSKDKASSYIFLPLNFGSRTYGYLMISYGTVPRSYDEVVRVWTGAIARGLEMLRIKESAALGESKKKAKKKAYRDRAEDKIPEKTAIDGVLSEEDSKNMELVRDILDNNLLSYYFQPIVSALDGSIFAYEALMRATTEKKISPLEIIKYAYMMGRLRDVEKLTFMNALSIADEDEKLKKSKVFINSIPGTRLNNYDSQRIDSLLEKLGDRAVIELTEQAEIDDTELSKMKDKYERLGVGFAVDDYGTGYSNVSNLLRYMPNYVKIDRSLLSDIQDNVSKQHFVKSVIDFCHTNNILALAEGVETQEELRMVIMLGADLIQGYFTGRPAQEVIGSIDPLVMEEIKEYREEYMSGGEHQVYVAGRTNRVLLNNLARDGCNTILVTNEEVTYRNISIIGAPGLETDIHIEIQNGYEGSITLENVSLSNTGNQPVIKMDEDVNVIINLIGDNYLNGGGIRVPEGAKISFEGDGDLFIKLTGDDYYGIGGNVKSHHGDIEFFQDGKIEIVSDGNNGVGIGSGGGGLIQIQRGRFEINLNGDAGTGIGSYDGNTNIVIDAADIDIRLSMFHGVCIGSLNSDSRIRLTDSRLRCYVGGKHICILGTLGEGSTDIIIDDCDTSLNVGADHSVLMGSTMGKTSLRFLKSHLTGIVKGKEVFAFGGYIDDKEVLIQESRISSRIEADSVGGCRIPDDSITLNDSKYKISINGEEFTYSE